MILDKYTNSCSTVARRYTTVQGDLCNPRGGKVYMVADAKQFGVMGGCVGAMRRL